jgi:hypothetical protein
MITIPHILAALIAIVIVLTGCALVAWFIQREPAGHGTHRGRRKEIVTLPYLADGSYASAPPEPLPAFDLPRPGRKGDAVITGPGELAPHVIAGLASAKPDETAIDTDHATFSRWLENVTGGDPYDGKGGSDGLVEHLFAGLRGAS